MHPHEHAGSIVAVTFGAVAFVSEDLGRIAALLVGSGGLAISLIRLRWDLEDRREARAERARKAHRES